MKKVLLIILLFAVCIIAQESQPTGTFKVKVDNFRGGVNLAGDSTDLAPNEALSLKNFVITQNSAESRHGISTWNTNSIDTNGTPIKIDNIFIYEPYPDTLRLCIAAAGFIYIIPTLDNPAWDTTGFPGDGDSAWGQYRLGFSDKSLIATYNSLDVGRPSPSWFYLKVSDGDVLAVDGDSSNSEYVIANTDLNNDTVLTLTSVYKGATDNEADFTIYRKIYQGSANFRQNGALLYISGLNDFTIVYDDTNYQFLALVDSGMISSVKSIVDSAVYYNEGTINIRVNSNVVVVNHSAEFRAGNNVEDSMLFVALYSSYAGGVVLDSRWASIIINVDSAKNTLELLDNAPRTFWNQPYEISQRLKHCNFDTDIEVNDSSKNWFDDLYADEYLLGLYSIFNIGGVLSLPLIYCNADSGFQIDTSETEFSDYIAPSAGDYYYIFDGSCRISNGYFRFPFFEQIFVKNGQFYGFGKQVEAYDIDFIDKELKENRVWFSEIDIPFLMKSTYFFDLDKTENITTIFELINGGYIATTNSIWRFSGIAPTDVQVGDLQFRKITNNIGIPDIDNWAQATLEYIYFADETGLYFFNGIRPRKISDRIESVFKRYGQSDMVLGYYAYENQLFISWPDSDVTWIYDENFDAFLGPFDFGMICMNQQSAELDTNIFFFGHADTLGHVFFYPNSVYFDSMPGTSTTIAYEYRSGHQSHGDYSYTKKPLEIAVSTQSSGVMEIAFYSDFSTSKADSFVTDSTGNFVHIPPFSAGDVWGEYIQTSITASGGQKVILRGYTTEMQWTGRKVK